ncbi:unnamed protein product, partial [Meganyctiphanes norvegica]
NILSAVMAVLHYLLATAACALASSAQVCPDSFSKVGSYCFHWDLTYHRNHSSAESYCAELSSSLPYPTGDLDTWETDITEEISDNWGGAWPWSGATLDQDGGAWYWPDGTRVQEYAWATTQPNGDGQCAYLELYGLLWDQPCDASWHVLCQVPAGTAVTAEPPTTTAPGPSTASGMITHLQ